MKTKGRKLLGIAWLLAVVLLASLCMPQQALAGGTAPAASGTKKPVLQGEGINISYNYSGGKLTGYNLNDYLKNTGAAGSVQLKAEVKYSSGAKGISKTKTFTAKAGKTYHISFDAGFTPGDLKGSSIITISSASMSGSDQYEIKKVFILSISDIKVEELKDNAKLAKMEVYEGKQLLKLDGKGQGSYAAYVDSGTASVDIAAAADDPDASVSINGQSAKSSLKKTIALKAGDNTVTIKVTAPDGETGTTSVIKISRSSGTAAKKWTKSYGSVSELAADKSGVVYAGVGEGAKSYLLALNPNGTEKWKYAASGQVGAPAVGTDGTIYAPCGNGIIAVNSAGKLKWKYDAGAIINKKIVVGKDNIIYFGVFAGYSDEKYCSVGPDGKKRWEFKTGSVYSEYAVGEDNTFFYSTWDEQKRDDGYALHALKPDRSEKWSCAVSGQIQKLAIGEENIVLGLTSKKLFAFDSDSGAKKWEAPFDSYLNSLAIGLDGTIYTGGSGVLYATDSGGSRGWEAKLGEELYGMGVSPDGTIYVSSADHKIYAVDGKGAKKQEYLMTGISYFAPVILPDGSVCASTDDNKIFDFGK